MQHFLRNWLLRETHRLSVQTSSVYDLKTFCDIFFIPLWAALSYLHYSKSKIKARLKLRYFYFLAYLWSAIIAWRKISLNTFKMSCFAVDLALRVITTAWQPRHKAAQFFRWAQDMMVNILQLKGAYIRGLQRRNKEKRVQYCVVFIHKGELSPSGSDDSRWVLL